MSLEHGTSSFLRVPPDGAGKRLTTHRHTELGYNSGTLDFSVGDLVVGLSSGTTATIFRVDGDTATGDIYVLIDPRGNGGAFQVGESLQVGGVTYAIAGSSTDAHSQANVSVGANNPDHRQYIDQEGAAYVRFNEGPQQLDAYGLTRTTTPSQLAQYLFNYDSADDEFTDSLVGGATLSHLPTESAIAIDLTTANGDSGSRTSNRYHVYQSGFSQMTMMTIMCGNPTEAGVTRRWGYFDANDGIFFELKDGAMYVVQRTSVSGSPVETRIAQADWDADTADGSASTENGSGFLLDPSKVNIYWMDFQWLGGGRVRLGAYSKGQRITFHHFDNANTLSVPYMRQANLPVRIEATNTTATGNSTRLKLVCASVKTEGALMGDRERRTVKSTHVIPAAVTVTDSAFKALSSYRSTATVNSITNRFFSVPELLSIQVVTNPIIFQVIVGANLTGASFSNISGSALDADTSTTSYTGGRPILTWMLGVGIHNLEFPPNFGLLGLASYLKADGTANPPFTLAAKSLTAAATADVLLAVTWIDIG